MKSVENSWALERFQEGLWKVEPVSDYVHNSEKMLQLVQRPLKERIQIVRRDASGKNVEYLIDSAIKVTGPSEAYRRAQAHGWRQEYHWRRRALVGVVIAGVVSLFIGYKGLTLFKILGVVAAALALIQIELSSQGEEEASLWGDSYLIDLAKGRAVFYLTQHVAKQTQSQSFHKRTHFILHQSHLINQKIKCRSLWDARDILHPLELTNNLYISLQFSDFFKKINSQLQQDHPAEWIRKFLNNNPFSRAKKFPIIIAQLPPCLQMAAQDYELLIAYLNRINVIEHYKGDVREYQQFLKDWILLAKTLMARAERALQGEVYRPLLALSE